MGRTPYPVSVTFGRPSRHHRVMAYSPVPATDLGPPAPGGTAMPWRIESPPSLSPCNGGVGGIEPTAAATPATLMTVVHTPPTAGAAAVPTGASAAGPATGQ